MVLFRDRVDAGGRLAERVKALHLMAPLVLGLPRGGIPVAAEVARALDAPLDVFVARKVGLPGHEELGIGAVAEGLAEPVGLETAERFGVGAERMRDLAEHARRELQRRVRLYRGDRALPDLAERDVVLVDDGLATGVTAEASLRALRIAEPRRLVLAVPVCAPDTALRLAQLADDVVCVEAPVDFFGVGEWYGDFSQTTDDEVIEILEHSRSALGQRS